jgi:cytochrome c553
MKRFLFGLLCILCSLQTIAHSKTGQGKTAMCVGCHGARGISMSPDWPSLGGQHAQYIAKQLHDYQKASQRNSPMMTPLVAQLSPKDIQEIAEFYASLPLPKGKTRKKYLARGEELYRRGDYTKHITACIACHGPKGTGNARAGFPVLAGQQAAYTVQQLKAFKNKTRRNDLNSIMRDICARMSSGDMKAVAYYIAGLH